MSRRVSINSHLFPEVFEDLLTNKRYGVGSFFNADQIDTASFAAAAMDQWPQVFL